MLNFASLQKGFNKITVGALTNSIISAFGLNLSPVDIVLWGDRFPHILRHKPDFKDEETFIRCIEKIPEIISSPDYVGLHPSNNSIEFIKQVDELTLVAVRLRPHGSLAVRTVFPLSQSQLSAYINAGTVKKIS